MSQPHIDYSIDAHVASAFASDAEIRRLVKEAWDAARLRYVITDLLLRELAPLASTMPGVYENTQGLWFAMGFGSYLRTPVELQTFEIKHRRAALGDERFISIPDNAATYFNAVNKKFLSELSANERVQKDEHVQLSNRAKELVYEAYDRDRPKAMKAMLRMFDTMREVSYRKVLMVSLIRFRGHFPKGGYDVQNGFKQSRQTSATTVHGGVQGGGRTAGP